MRKVLILAYEYPPILAAQSLRWFYLANVLAEKNDLEVHVLTVKIRDIWGFSGQLHPRIRVHRSFPGPFVAVSGWLARQVQPSTTAHSSRTGRAASFLVKLYEYCRALLNQIVFPDVRTEWLPFAWHELKRLYAQERFQILISSHEPGVDLILGRRLKHRYPDVHWIVDLADPLLTPYTPKWRRALDHRLESKVCREADRLLTTNETIRHVLVARHALNPESLVEIAHGFTPLQSAVSHKFTDFVETVVEPGKRFTLLFTGNFYAGFRDPSELLLALRQLPDIVLIIAGSPGPYEKAFYPLKNRAKLLGPIDHFRCLALQEAASVLVNLGNTQKDQIPSKLYEYLGARRPILQIQSLEEDEGGQLISRLNRGETVLNRAIDIQAKLQALYLLWQEQRLDLNYDLSLEAVRDYCWEQHGKQLLQLFP